MEAEDIRNLAQAAQALLLSVAAICAGIWAIYRIRSTKEFERARIETEQAKRELQKQLGINLNMEIELGDPGKDGTPGFILLNYDYQGQSSVLMELGPSPLKVALVTNHSWELTERSYQWNAELGLDSADPTGKSPYRKTISKVILPNSKGVLPFYYLFDTVGVYLLSFHYSTNGSISDHLQEVFEAGSDEIRRIRGEDEVRLSVRKFVQIKLPNKTEQSNA